MYTGKETKVAMNTKPTPSKLSTLDKLLNRALAVLMGGLVVLTVVSDGLALWWRGEFFHLSPNVVNGSTTCGDVNTSCEPAYLFPVNQPFDNYLLPPWLAYFFTFAILYVGCAQRDHAGRATPILPLLALLPLVVVPLPMPTHALTHRR